MFGFLKKIFGLPTDEEIKAAQEAKVAPYKVEPPVINNKTGDVFVPPPPPALLEEPKLPSTVEVKATVNPQITDSVTQEAPAKKTRKPRTPKVEKVVKVKATKEKAAKAKKPAAISTSRKSKKS